MKTQLSIFDGERLKTEGIARAEATAERLDPGFNEKAFEFFKDWLSGWPKGYQFMMEDFRESAHFRGLEAPASKRVFGGLAAKARRQELIIAVGMGKVKNKTAHRCFATTWQKL